ncbi:MAG TPA: glycosyltransferase family 4 protein [Casimicrobiaceae bacterium]
MKIAFYAPLKAPDHPVPSGDRAIARGLLDALTLAGHDVMLASRLRSFDAHGDSQRQARLAQVGERTARRLVARFRLAQSPAAWFTYHLHHKAPDHVGPSVSRALRIPYIVAEASIAPRQREGPWAAGYAASYAAIRSADNVVFVNPSDVAQVRNARGADAPFAMLAPFIDVARFAGSDGHRQRPAHRPPRLVTVAMMRDGAKLASYRLLAAALARIADVAFTLTIVGDGPVRNDVEAAFAPIAQRVTYAGVLAPSDIAALLRESDVFAWPAIDEAIGIAFLEAQACGLPVIGADTPGVASVVAANRSGVLVPPRDADAFAHAVRRLVDDESLRERMAAEALAYVRMRHDLPSAARQLDAIIGETIARHRRAALLPC